MRLKIPPITQPINLGDFAPEMEQTDDGQPARVWVWVNPPAPLIAEYDLLRGRSAAVLKVWKENVDNEEAIRAAALDLAAVGQELAEFYAKIWSARAEPETHWTAAEVLELAENKENPALYRWLTDQTLALIRSYRAGLRKN